MAKLTLIMFLIFFISAPVVILFGNSMIGAIAIKVMISSAILAVMGASVTVG